MTGENVENTEYINEPDQGKDKDPKPGKPHPWRYWFTVLATPLAGWKRIRNSRMPVAAMEQTVLYPLIALAAVCAFAGKFYYAAPLELCLYKATCNFVALFASYFLIFPLSKLCLAKDYYKRVDSSFGHCYVAILLSTLALFYSLYQCLPTVADIIMFTPAYTIYLAYKGIGVLNFPEKNRIMSWLALIAFIIFLPFFLYDVMEWMLPSNINKL